jgi:hypothetical protein
VPKGVLCRRAVAAYDCWKPFGALLGHGEAARQMRKVVASLLAGLVLTSGSSAAWSQTVRQLGPHVHGDSELTIAVDGKSLAMELHAPGMDVFGFEHPPGNDAERAVMASATAALKDPVALFGIPAGAGCKATTAEVNLVPDTGEDQSDPGTAATSAAGHSDVDAVYELACTSLAAITGLNLAFFAKFPDAVQVQIDLVTAKGASSLTATRANSSVSTRNMF